MAPKFSGKCECTKKKAYVILSLALCGIYKSFFNQQNVVWCSGIPEKIHNDIPECFSAVSLAPLKDLGTACL